ncbi:unnamed protein product [Psylliodes chrysocephalus]|uniref:Uncharacterized protein n=1 Tax=Psylliodes chrysocephalus TaxID=3402493 RepID=A0A9P0CW20_9CUCU|nr:unnamed protein product [Psylliodes chrysocephala]
MLPPLFEMEDYESCIKQGNLYCKVDAVLKVPFNNTSVQREINEYVSNHDTFDRSVIHRAICLPTQSLSSNEPLEKQLSELINIKIGSYNLTTEVDYHVCSSQNIPVTLFDNIYLYSYAAYIVLVLFATFYEAVTKTSSKG